MMGRDRQVSQSFTGGVDPTDSRVAGHRVWWGDCRVHAVARVVLGRCPLSKDQEEAGRAEPRRPGDVTGVAGQGEGAEWWRGGQGRLVRGWVVLSTLGASVTFLEMGPGGGAGIGRLRWGAEKWVVEPPPPTERPSNTSGGRAALPPTCQTH